VIIDNGIAKKHEVTRMPEVITLGETMVMFSPEQSGPLRYVPRFQKRIAGSESNVAIGLVRLGHDSGWISRVGADEFGEFLIREIRGEGVDVSEARFDPEAPTGIMFKEVREGRETRVTYYRQGSAASRLSPTDLNPEYFRGARVLHLTGITPALSASCLDAVEAAVALARNHGLTVSFDPNLRWKLWSRDRAKAVLTRLLTVVDIVLSGMDEAEFLLGPAGPEALLDGFLQHGATMVALKLGAKGAWVASARERHWIEAFEVERVIDPIGAGDAFAAGFLAGMLEGKPLAECGRLANAMGALAVTTAGDFEGLPVRRELEDFMNRRDQAAR
jgi:2-dehydro-3-deoxygluconokinase